MPSERYERQARCGTKVRYSTEAAATNAATALGWIGRHGLEPYECEYCQHWHVGHGRKRARR